VEIPSCAATVKGENLKPDDQNFRAKVNMREYTDGFSSEKEKAFLQRLKGKDRRVNLSLELLTQLQEDFGMVQFTIEYRRDSEGRLYDPVSGQKTVELTARGNRKEETASIAKIEQGLREHPELVWINFSPKNEEYYYPSDCVDFWRVVDDGRVIWNRIVVKENFEDMNRIRSFLSGESEVKDNFEILAAPISSKLELTELFNLFKLNEVKNSCTLDLIQNVVDDYVDEFEKNFGAKLTEDSDLIFRLYSACYKALSRGKIESERAVLSRDELRDYMYGEMLRVSEVDSFGCAFTTAVGEFGSKVGYYIGADGQVKFGEIPDDYKECKKCGCWYKGEKCPFC